VIDIGRKLKTLRKKYRLSQDKLAERAGITKAHLSLIENKKRSVTVKTLRKILEVMNESLASFFSEPDDDNQVVYRESSYISIPEANETYTNKLLIPFDGDRKLEPIEVVIKPGGTLGDPYTHKGEEFGLVLKGKGLLNVDGIEYEISKGDRFYYSSNLLHTVQNLSDEEEMHVLFVSTPPTF